MLAKGLSSEPKTPGWVFKASSHFNSPKANVPKVHEVHMVVLWHSHGSPKVNWSMSFLTITQPKGKEVLATRKGRFRTISHRSHFAVAF
jgi:hypothetical protein